MTIAIGFNCVDGIVLCADSLESDTVTKKHVQKLWTYQVADEWGLAIASAGEADLADNFADGLKDILGNDDFDEQFLLLRLRTAIGQVRMSYPDGQLAMLVAWFCRQTMSTRLFRVMDGSPHLGPVSTHQSLGIGAHLCQFLCSHLYRPTMFVEEAISLGVFAVARAKEYVDGCGGFTSVVSYTKGKAFWEMKLGNETREMEKRFPDSSFRAALQDYWKDNNPPPKWTMMTGGPEVEYNEVPGPRIMMTTKLKDGGKK